MKKEILLVEDNSDDAEFTVRAFSRSSFSAEIILAVDGAAALSRLFPDGGAPGLRPTLVLLDINMPKLGGFDVLRQLRADPGTRYLPVIMLTTSSLDHDILESYRLGANGYVCKSLSFDDYHETIKALGDYWLRFNLVPGSGPAELVSLDQL